MIFDKELFMRAFNSDKTTVATPEILKAYSLIEQVVEFGTTGAVIYGRPRLGKTRAIQYIITRLKEKYPDMPILCMYTTDHKATDRQFYAEMLDVVGLEYTKHKTAQRMRTILKKALIASADNTRYRRICLFVDEAQLLTLVDYHCLIDLYNILEHESIQLTVILVGQPELKAQKDAFKMEGQHQIIGRFMMRSAEFKGIQSSKALALVLRELDHTQHLLQGSSSLMEIFYNKAFLSGIELDSIANDLLGAFEEQNHISGIPFSDIGMRYIIDTLLCLFVHYSDRGTTPAGFPDQQLLQKCIQEIGYGI